MLRLQAQEKSIRQLEEVAQAHVGISGDRAAIRYDGADSLRWYFDRLCQAILRNAKRVQKFCFQDLTGRGRLDGLAGRDIGKVDVAKVTDRKGQVLSFAS